MAPSDAASQTAAEASPDQSASVAPSVSDPIVFADKYEIRPERELTEFGSPGVSAYSVRNIHDRGGETIAFVSHSGLPVRPEVLTALRGIDNPHVLRLEDFGTVFWPADRQKRAVAFFERSIGHPLVASLDAPQTPLHEDQVTRDIIPSVCTALRELKMRRLFHGRINPTNLFNRDGDSKAIVLGEFLMSPAGLGQPVIFETIERGLADPSARGNGTAADDLYALGVTLLVLLLGGNPLAGRSDREISEAKIEDGSFNALIGTARLPQAINEPVRGLLLDDPMERWTLEDMELWISGRRLSPKQARPPARAIRAMRIEGVECWTARQLSYRLAQAPAIADTILDDGSLDVWLRRSLQDDAMADQVTHAVRTAGAGSGGSFTERRLSRVLMALDPPAPIRYRGRAVMLEGLNGALAEAVINGGSGQDIAEIISGQLPMFWINVQYVGKTEFVPLAKTADRLRGYLDKRSPGSGIERCLYEGNPLLPCLSPMVEGAFALQLSELVAALEKRALEPDLPALPVDRHIAAFILAHNGDLTERALAPLGEEQPPHVRSYTALEVLAHLQSLTQVTPLPGLCAWMVKVLQPAIDQYRSKTVRTRLTEELASQAGSGLLPNLLVLLGSADLQRRDLTGFEAAKRDFALAGQEIVQRQAALADGAEAAREQGAQAAAIVASVLSSILLVGIVAASAV
ncbi:MAG: serine/threonine protein kinase [Inquilinaceae bacterium]